MPGRSPINVFVWHDPTDSEIADKLTRELVICGLEVSSKSREKLVEQGTMDISAWQMNVSHCILFLLSKKSIKNKDLFADVDRIMRRKNVLIVPVTIEAIPKKNLPVILKLIHHYTISHDITGMAEQLVKNIQSKISGKPSNIMKPSRIWFYPSWWVLNHYRHYLALSPLTFCWQITVENLMISMSVTGLILFFFQPETRSNLDNINAGQFFWLVIILSPLIETFVLQVIPVYIAKKFGLMRTGQIIFSTLPFAILHFTRSVGAGIGAGIIGGFYSGFTFVHWDQKSLRTAFWVTALSHCLYNMAIFAMIIGDY